MKPDYDMQLAHARDRHWEIDEELFKVEMKLNKAIESITAKLDPDGKIQQAADELTRKAIELKAQLQEAAEEVAFLETKVSE